MASNRGLDSELESFRQKWLLDLRSSRDNAGSSSSQGRSQINRPSRRDPAKRGSGPPSPKASRKPIWDEGDYLQGYNFDEIAPGSAPTSEEPQTVRPKEKKAPESALDYYEEAMQKEAIGNMGDSLKLYRQAYKMDSKVEKRYREKYFPAASIPASTNSTQTGSTRTQATQATINPTPAAAADIDAKPLTISELLDSFSLLKIEALPPDVEGAPQPPCPIAQLPDELLIHIMRDVAVADVGDFVRLSLVCKHLAFIVAVEQSTWRHVCLGPEVGFAGMHYRWRSAIEWASSKPSGDDYIDENDEEPMDEQGNLISPREMAELNRMEIYLTSCLLTPSVYPSWKNMFRHRPRIRFNGCYISTVNYIRAGQASTNQPTWGNNPIHIVTYYRYLRFFRDGSLISLLTTSEPTDIVHHLTRQLLVLHQDSAQGHLPSAVMHLAHRGRWRLSSPVLGGIPQPTTKHVNDTSAPSGDGDLYIETEGVGTKYIYRMDLSLRSAGKSSFTKNNKLVWRAFYSYNKMTDDWGEFGLKNDKPFFFSRVRSYGRGQ